jgi:PAS domain S-box-containing protein
MERLRWLSELAAELALSTDDYESLLALCARRLSERFGDLCIIRLVSSDGKFLEPSVAVYGADPVITESVRRATGRREPLHENAFIGRVIETGKALLIPKVLEPGVFDSSPQLRELADRVGVTSFVIAPLVSHGQTIGAASLTRRGGRPYEEHDLRLLQDIAAHAALAIETARTNRALTESSRAHQLLFEASPVPVFVYDVETLVPLTVNRAALALFGHTKEEFMQLEVSTLVGLDPASARERLAALGDRDASGTLRYVRKNGTEIVGEYTSRAHEFAGRRARITALKDVTARSEADATRALLAAIVESSNDAIVCCALDGSVVTWNDGARRLFGYSAEEMIGQPFRFVLPKESVDDDEHATARIARGDHVATYEAQRVRRDGSTVNVAVSLAAIRDGARRVVAIARTARDLTAQREAAEALARTEAHLRQSQKMEAVGRLAGGVAHDFNNMLAVILSYCSIIVDELAPDAPWREEVLEIEQAATRAADLTRQLLVFSRQNVVVPKIVDLNALIHGMKKMLARIVGEDVELSFEPGESIGSICVDPSSIDQVVLNLVVNARDAMPDGGSLAITTREVIVEGQTFVAVDVADTGAGMDAATQARIFEPFFTTKAPGRGTGLGLATVFGIAQHAGGGVRVTSTLGEGSKLTVYFPRVEGEEAEDAPASHEGAPRAATILLVEDEPQVRAVTAKILRREGYRVLVAAAPNDALRVCADHVGSIDLLLTDVVMPQMNGATLSKRISELRGEMKTLYISGYTDESTRNILTTSVAFLQKPFTSRLLTNKVREVLDPEIS